MISKLALEVNNSIRRLFPHETIVPEYYVYYKNNKLFFDFFLKGLNILVECQGRQHFGFVKHFHGNAEEYKLHKKRDRLKADYARENSISLVYFNDGGPDLTDEFVRRTLYEAQCGTHAPQTI